MTRVTSDASDREGVRSYLRPTVARDTFFGNALGFGLNEEMSEGSLAEKLSCEAGGPPTR
jgi:hypothetical protein